VQVSLFAPPVHVVDERGYQIQAIAAVHKGFELYRRLLLVMATGTGKTETFGKIIKEWPGDVLVIAHRDELLDQAKKRLEGITGEWVEIEKAEQRAYAARIVVASAQTLASEARLKAFAPDRFSLIVIDEAHHYVAPTFIRPIEYFAKANVLGVTATPDRGDGIALRKGFDHVAFQYDIADAIEDGYLVPVRGHREVLKDLDISQVKKTNGRLNDAQLDEAVILAVDAMVRKTLELYPSRRGIAFFPGVKSAELAAEKFNLHRPGSAIVISGKTRPELRRKLVKDFKTGKYQYLCNCQVATEGFDAPDVSLVIMGRPTLSRALYAQMVGRGTRVLPGICTGIAGARDRKAAVAASAKPDCVILDFVGNSGKHDLMAVEDVLGGKYTDAEVKKAKLAAKVSGGSEDVTEALERARAALREMAKLSAGVIKSRTEMFNPFRVLSIPDDSSPVAARDKRPASARQVEALEKFGVNRREMIGMAFVDASKLLDSLIVRARDGLATYRQMKQLREYGVAKADKVKFADAKLAMDFIARCRFAKSPGINRAVQAIAQGTPRQ
jgi:superfamily II DNA or RNA helicase